MTLGRRKAVFWLLIILGAWAMVCVLRATAFGGVWRPVAAQTWAILAIWLISFATGYGIGLRPIILPHVAPLTPPVSWFNRWVQRLSIAAIIGALLIVYEFAFYRGYGFSTPVEVIRQTEIENSLNGTSGSGISGIGRLLVPALIVGWVLTILRPSSLARSTWVALLLASIAVIWQQAMFEGGRLFLASLLVSCAVARQLRPTLAPPGLVSHRKQRVFPIAVFGAIALFLFGAVFVDRMNTRGSELDAGYEVFTGSFTIDVSERVYDSLAGGWASVNFVAYMFWMYVTQGPNEFNRLLEYPLQAHGFGALQFGQISHALSKLTGQDLTYKTFENMPNPGTYTTIMGPNYMDFGFALSWLFALLLGYVTCTGARAISSGHLGWSALAAPMLITIGLFSPIVSLVINLWPAVLIALLLPVTKYWLPTAGRRPSQVVS
jgi:hypothetical protein